LIVSKFVDDIIINPHFSKHLAGTVIALHLGSALVLLIPVSLPNGVKWGILIALIISLLHNFQKYVLLKNCTLCDAIFHYDSLWLKTGKKAELLASYAEPWLVILNARTQDGKKHRLVLFSDSLEKTTFRRLRVRLRHLLKDEDE